MYLSTRISRLYKRGHFLSTSLYISVCVCVYVCVCVLDWYFRACSVCVEGGGMEGLFPSWISKLFLISLIYFSFFLFFDDIPPPCNSYKAAPISSSLCNVYVCVCVCLWLSTSVLLILTGLPNIWIIGIYV